MAQRLTPTEILLLERVVALLEEIKVILAAL